MFKSHFESVFFLLQKKTLSQQSRDPQQNTYIKYSKIKLTRHVDVNATFGRQFFTYFEEVIFLQGFLLIFLKSSLNLYQVFFIMSNYYNTYVINKLFFLYYFSNNRMKHKG